MVYWTPFPWYVGPSANGISNSLLWYYEPFIHDIPNSLPMVFWTPTLDILDQQTWFMNPLHMAYSTSHVMFHLYDDFSIMFLFSQHPRGTNNLNSMWYSDPGVKFSSCILHFELLHGKLKPNEISNSLLWHYEPLINGIPNKPLPMVLWTPYPWNIEPLPMVRWHTPLSMVYRTPTYGMLILYRGFIIPCVGGS
jgi:hypothetical protein